MADNVKDTASGMTEGEAMLVFSRSSVAMVLTDPTQPDNPIVYVNRAFERMAGYSFDFAVGRNCRFLQGEDTNPEDIQAIREALAGEREISLDILNYRADGAPFTNRLLISPIHDSEGRLSYFLGIQKDLSRHDSDRPTPSFDRSLQEIQHRVKNHLAMIVGLIRLQSREVGAAGGFDTLARRIESLQLLYEELSRPSVQREMRIELGSYLGRITTAVAHIDGRPGIRLNIDVAAVYVDAETGLRLGLVLSEILTNAFQHAFEDREEGLIEVQVHGEGGGLRVEVRDNGSGMADGAEWPDPTRLGGRIVTGLVEGLDGRLELQDAAPGTRAVLTMPLPLPQNL